MPDPREVRERLGDDHAVVRAEPLEAGVLGMQAAYRVRVGGREQRSRLPIGRVAHRPQGLTVRHTEAALHRVVDPEPPCGRLDETDGALQRPDRVLFKTEAEGEVEDHLRVGRSMDLCEERRLDGQHQLSPEQAEISDVPVVDEQPAPVAKRMAVGLLHRRADRGSHVGHEQRRLDVGRELAQVRVTPRRLDAAVDPRALARAIPAEAEAISVGRLRAHAGVQTLIDDPVRSLEQQLLDQHRLPEPCHPATHRSLLCSRSTSATRRAMVAGISSDRIAQMA
jgi:hypothetical protein